MKISFFFTDKLYSIVGMYHIFIICVSVEGNLGCFHSLAIMNRAIMTMAEYTVSVQKDVESLDICQEVI